MKLRPPMGSARGSPAFTLVELLLSFSLMVIVVGCAYACLSAGFAAQRVIEPRTDLIQNARVAMALITADLRAACVLPGDAEFIGVERPFGELRADNLDFATHNYSPVQPAEGDFCEVSYFVEPDLKTGENCLWRRRNPVIGLDPLSGGKREAIASGVRGLKAQYSDGFEWYESWGDPDKRRKQAGAARTYGNLYGLPEAVRITLWVDSERRKGETEETRDKSEATAPPPLVFKTVVRLNLAASAAAASTANTSASPSPGQAAPDQAGPGGPQ